MLKMSYKLSKLTKSVYILTSGLALGIGAYAFYRYWKRRESKCIDEGFEDVSKLEDVPEKKILILGLEGAGKTTLVSQMTTGLLNINDIKPTDGFYVTNLIDKDISLNFWDVGGSEKTKRFWSNFLQDTDLLIFVVDAHDTHKIAIAIKEIKALTGDDRLKGVPIFFVASKQDILNALSPEEVADALDIKSIHPSQRAVKVFGSQISHKNEVHSSILDIKKAIIKI